MDEIVVYDLKVLPKTTQIRLSELGFIDIKYVPLETTEKSIINKINEIKVGSGFFIIKYFNDILKFDSNGFFVNKIGIEGRGPGEFIIAHDVEIDTLKHRIYLVDGWVKKFNVYTEDGVFIRTFQSPFNTINFEIFYNQILCYSTNYIANTENSYNLIDTNGILLKAYPNKYPWQYKVRLGTAGFEENLFYKSQNRVYKKEIYCDTVFMFEKESFLPYIVINHGDKLLTTQARSEFNPEFLLENYISQKKLFEFGDYLYYEFAIGLMHYKRYSLIGSKRTGFEYLISADQGFINDLDCGPNILPKAVKDENTIIAWIDALQLKKHITSDEFRKSTPKYPEKKKELERFANNLKETDNPILILVKLKK